MHVSQEWNDAVKMRACIDRLLNDRAELLSALKRCVRQISDQHDDGPYLAIIDRIETGDGLEAPVEGRAYKINPFIITIQNIVIDEP